MSATASREANEEALRRVAGAQPFLVDVRRAGAVIAGLGKHDFLHAGPPLEGWPQACGALRGAITGTMVHAGLASDVRAAEEAAGSGAVRLSPANDRSALATYGAVIAADTPVLVVENRAANVHAYAALNEGRGRALRYGANDAQTLSRLAWLEGEFAELFGAALRLSGGIDVFDILVQALHMGDDGHSRQKAASALLLAAVAPWLAETDYTGAQISRALRFMAQNDIFFLPVTMAAAKSALAVAEGIADSSLVTCMCTNGARFGIRVSGASDRWFTAPLPEIHGTYFEGYGPQDANPVIGDSEIAETLGLGAFAMPAAPALARYVGGTLEDAVRLSGEMYSITLAEHPRFTIPTLSYRGTPFGIDARRIVARAIEPVFNTGIAHREPGIGQIGAGFGRAPLACFRQAVDYLS
jgi:hypothetical protein